MVALTEREVRKRLIRSFMEYDPLILDLTRPIMTRTASGGTIETGTLVISDQQFYFMPFFRRLTNEIDRNPQSYGEDRNHNIEYILIFMPEDVDVKEGDFFTAPDDTSLMEPGDYRIHFLSKRKWDRQQAVVRLRS